jgi:type I restriction enzyme S subunit
MTLPKHPLKKDFVRGGVPFITANCVRNFTVSPDPEQTLDSSWKTRLRIGHARSGDVLLTHKGTVGEVAIVPDDLPEVILSPQVTLYRVQDSNVISREYLAVALLSRKFQDELKAIASAQSTRAYIGITKQKTLAIPIPELNDQKQVVESFFATADAIATYRHLEESASQLFSSLLHHLMTGKVRIPEFAKAGQQGVVA